MLKSYEEPVHWDFHSEESSATVVCINGLNDPVLGGFRLVCAIQLVPELDKGGFYKLPGVASGPVWLLMWEETAYLGLAWLGFALLWMVGAYKHRIIIWLLLAASLVVTYWRRALDRNTQIILFLLPSFFIGTLTYLHVVSC